MRRGLGLLLNTVMAVFGLALLARLTMAAFTADAVTVRLVSAAAAVWLAVTLTKLALGAGLLGSGRARRGADQLAMEDDEPRVP